MLSSKIVVEEREDGEDENDFQNTTRLIVCF